MNRKWLVLVVAIVGVSAAVVNAQFSRNFEDEFLRSSIGRAFLETYGYLKSNYLNEIDDETIVQGAIQGMIEALDDPYTSYGTPDEAARDNQDRQGSFEGIGAVLQARNRKDNTIVEIINVYRDGPAWNAGVQKGDIFIEVDDVNVEDFTINEIVERVRGPKDSIVELGMRRPGVEELVRFSIVRGRIDIVSVESAVLPNNVGYLSISTFANQRVYDQLTEQLAALESQGISSLILDLRDNGGGLLNQGILVADEFLSQGDIVFQRAKGVTQRLASADPAYFDLPMVVLVNQNSASASEIVAGALQDNGRAQVVGVETFGKGVGQSVVSLGNGGQLVYLSFEWLTPDRRSINQQGIEPDIRAEDTRFSSVVSLEGQGAVTGSEIEVFVNGESIGKTIADEDGNFDLFQSLKRREFSSVQGQAIVDLENDEALQIAYNTVLETMQVGN